MFKFLISFLFTTNLLALTAGDDSNYYSVEFSPLSSGFDVDKCLGSANTDDFCYSTTGGLKLTFNEPVNITNLDIATSGFNIDTYINGSLDTATNFNNVNTIEFFNSGSITSLLVAGINFNFTTATSTPPTETTGEVNWSAFTYGFTIIAFFALLGRGGKAILDAIRYG